MQPGLSVLAAEWFPTPQSPGISAGSSDTWLPLFTPTTGAWSHPALHRSIPSRGIWDAEHPPQKEKHPLEQCFFAYLSWQGRHNKGQQPGVEARPCSALKWSVDVFREHLFRLFRSRMPEGDLQPSASPQPHSRAGQAPAQWELSSGKEMLFHLFYNSHKV